MMRPARIYAVAVNRVAHPIWRGLMVIRVAIVIAALCILATDWAIARASAAPKGNAAPQDLRAQRQASVAHVLAEAAPEVARSIRAGCASGRQVGWTATRRSVGFNDLPDAVAYCVAALTRLGRDGTLGFVRDNDTSKTTPALAFDGGFVTGYRQHPTISSALPSMAELRPIAARCLAQREPNGNLCTAAGYAFGARAAVGEIVMVE